MTTKRILLFTGILLLSLPAFGAKKKNGGSRCQDDLKSLAEALAIQHKGNDGQKEAWDTVRDAFTKIKDLPSASAEIANVGLSTTEAAQLALSESGKHLILAELLIAATKKDCK